jgi:hypothetical protein
MKIDGMRSKRVLINLFRVCNRITYSFAIRMILNNKLLINIIAQLILLHTLKKVDRNITHLEIPQK